MADVPSSFSESAYPEYFSQLTSNLFHTEKSLIKLRQGLPVEKQESFTKSIQQLSKERVSFISSIKGQTPFNHEENSRQLASIQERFNDCLNEMISEIVEGTENYEYKESEGVGNVLRRVKTSTKGMIVGNFNEVIATMDRILGIGEGLIVQGYQKLFIDSVSMKDKLQDVIDERQNLPVCSRPLETLMIKQNFCEKQLTCLLTLLEQANTLTDLINKLQDFDKRQIQFQQASQFTIDSMKKFFYKPEIRKHDGRRRTYLSVSYADPSNPREGLDILRDQIASVLRNLNNLTDLEDLKVRTVKHSDLGSECEKAYDEALSLFEEEKEIFKKTLGILVSIEDNQIDLERSDRILDEFKLPEESPQTQLDFIKFFVQLGLTTPKQRIEQARLMLDLVTRFDQDHSTYSSLVDRLQEEINDLTRENLQLKNQSQDRVMEKIGEGKHSLQELIELQEHLKSKIQESLETQLKKQINDAIMVSCGIGDLLVEMNPEEDLKIRVTEFQEDYKNASNLNELVELLNKYQAWVFRLVCKLGKVSEGAVHSNLVNLKKCKSLLEARESLSGKPAEFPLAAMDRILSEIIKSYLAGVDERKNNVESVVQKQAVLMRLLKENKN